ncbi:MAG: hypothetical protein GWP14_06205 [Actinobacteria bacterium]|nr:hypothetical protein [Actinomycetota bacterium]
MNCTKYILTTFFIVSATYIVGCTYTYDKSDPEPPMARRAKDSYGAAYFDSQADNAILTSMTVADVHFVPYRAELNSLGRSHVTAIASYLERYGGDVTLESQQVDAVVTQQRVDNVRDFLVAQGLDPEQLTITTGLAKGRGQDAAEAVLFYYKNLMPEESSSAGQALDPSAAAGSAAAGATEQQ